MPPSASQPDRLSEAAVQRELQRQPHLLMQLAQNTLTVGRSLRDNYFANTAKFVAALRQAVVAAQSGKREPVLTVSAVEDANWPAVAGEVVTFIDGGIGRVQFASRTPILLRVGSYNVRIGERRLAEREQFGYYPIILGDLARIAHRVLAEEASRVSQVVL